MFSKEEKKELIKKFWDSFYVYSSRLPYHDEKRRRWVLHHTKISNVHFKFDPGRDSVKVILEIHHKDEAKRLLQYEKIEMYKVILEDGIENGLIWDFAHKLDTGQLVCWIYKEKRGLDLHKISHWEEIFKFMSDNMYKLENNFLEIRDLIR